MVFRLASLGFVIVQASIAADTPSPVLRLRKQLHEMVQNSSGKLHPKIEKLIKNKTFDKLNDSQFVYIFAKFQEDLLKKRAHDCVQSDDLYSIRILGDYSRLREISYQDQAKRIHPLYDYWLEFLKNCRKYTTYNNLELGEFGSHLLWLKDAKFKDLQEQRMRMNASQTPEDVSLWVDLYEGVESSILDQSDEPLTNAEWLRLKNLSHALSLKMNALLKNNSYFKSLLTSINEDIPFIPSRAIYMKRVLKRYSSRISKTQFLELFQDYLRTALNPADDFQGHWVLGTVLEAWRVLSRKFELTETEIQQHIITHLSPHYQIYGIKQYPGFLNPIVWGQPWKTSSTSPQLKTKIDVVTLKKDVQELINNLKIKESKLIFKNEKAFIEYMVRTLFLINKELLFLNLDDYRDFLMQTVELPVTRKIVEALEMRQFYGDTEGLTDSFMMDLCASSFYTGSRLGNLN